MPFQPQPVNRVRMAAVVRLAAFDCAGDDVRVAPADSPVHLVEPHGRATLGRQEQLGDDEKAWRP